METYGAGIVVLLFNHEGDILVGERKGSHGAGTLSLPGGKLEFMETALVRISKELDEETDIQLPPERFTVCNWIDNIWTDPDKGQQHWVTLFTEAVCPSDQHPRTKEPDKCAGWEWADPATLLRGPRPLFHPLAEYLRKYPYPTWRYYKGLARFQQHI